MKLNRDTIGRIGINYHPAPLGGGAYPQKGAIMFVFDVIILALILFLDVLVLILFFSEGTNKFGIFGIFIFPLIYITYEALCQVF
jgi:hypothetical protein